MTEEIALEDCSLHIAMGPFGSSIKKSTFVEQGVPIISGKHLKGTKLNEQSGFNYITEEHAKRHANSIIHRGDVVFTAYGTLGQVSFVPSDSQFERYIASQRQFFIRPNIDILKPRYLTYFFHSPLGQHLLLSNASQVGVPSIASPTSFLRSLKIPVPNLSQQNAIVHILGTLDDKIELIQKMNQNLEDITKAIFKSWFIDFDPVKAKAQGRPTGLSQEISDLFPDSFQSSELGEIPNKWYISKLSDHMEFIYGKGLTKNQRITGNIPVYGSNGIVGYHNESNFKGPGIIVGRAGNPGTVHWVYSDCFAIDSAFSVKIKNGLSSNFYFYILKRLKLERLNSGSAIPGLNRNLALQEIFICPSTNLIDKFNEYCFNFFNKIEINLFEINNLIKLRDTLLPKLISGKLRIKDAEKYIEEAGI